VKTEKLLRPWRRRRRRTWCWPTTRTDEVRTQRAGRIRPMDGWQGRVESLCGGADDIGTQSSMRPDCGRCFIIIARDMWRRGRDCDAPRYDEPGSAGTGVRRRPLRHARAAKMVTWVRRLRRFQRAHWLHPYEGPERMLRAGAAKRVGLFHGDSEWPLYPELGNGCHLHSLPCCSVFPGGVAIGSSADGYFSLAPRCHEL